MNISQITDTNIDNTLIVKNYSKSIFSKDTYINIACEPCVICLECTFEKNKIPFHCNNFIESECECDYYIHKDCFRQWMKARPTNDIKCLICASDAKFHQTVIEKCLLNRFVQFSCQIFVLISCSGVIIYLCLNVVLNSMSRKETLS
jgi:hypothetical protein